MIIDCLEFARTGQSWRGTIKVADMARLADGLIDDAGELICGLDGGTDGQRRPVLRLTVRGVLNLQCQRCLGGLAHALAIEVDLRVLLPGDGAPDAALEDLDGIPANPRAEVLTLVEDEVLLALPFAPKHVDGACRAAANRHEERESSPFKALMAIKRNSNNRSH